LAQVVLSFDILVVISG